jgi:hypothetical protein
LFPIDQRGGARRYNLVFDSGHIFDGILAWLKRELRAMEGVVRLLPIDQRKGARRNDLGHTTEEILV